MVHNKQIDRQKYIERITADPSLTEEEKERYVKYILFSDPSLSEGISLQSSQTPKDIQYENFILIDKINEETIFCGNEQQVLSYLSELNLTVDEVVIYRKQTVRLNFENSD